MNPGILRDQFIGTLKSARWLEKRLRQIIANDEIRGDRRARIKENADFVSMLVNDLEDELAIE